MRVLIAILLLAVAPAMAQTPGTTESKNKAREWFRTGTQHYDLGEFRDALHDFKEAYRNYEEPIFLFNIGQCHRQLGEKEPAVRFFKVYLSKSPNAPNKTEVNQMIGKLEAALTQERALQSGRPMGTMSPPENRPEAKPEAETKPAPEAKPEPPPLAVVETKPAPAAAVVEKPASAEKPVYKKWWLWTAVAAVVVVGVGIGLGVGLAGSGSTPSASTDFGTYKPF